MPLLTSKQFKNKKSKKGTQTLLNLYSHNAPNVVIVAGDDVKKNMPEVRSSFNLQTMYCNLKGLPHTVTENTIAIIMDEKMLKKGIVRNLDKVLSKYKFLPLFYLSRLEVSPRFYKVLYEKGVEGIINWPRDSKIVHELLIEVLKPHPKAMGKSRGDVRLSEVIKSHLLLEGEYQKVKVKVVDGYVMLEGTVKTLYDKKNIFERTSKILGVKKVLENNLVVKTKSEVTDKEIQRRIKMYMSTICGNRRKSLLVKAKKGTVTLFGAAANLEEIREIERFASKIPGVKKLDRQVEFRPALVKRNVERAKLLEQKLKDLFDGVEHISINLYGEFAEVSGMVKFNSDRILVEKYIQQVLPVRRIVNKIYTSGTKGV